MVSLRNPVDRAYSNYLNDIVAGVVSPTQGFPEALQSHPEYVESGRYAHYLGNYLELFPRDQLLVSIFDDARREPLAAIQAAYRFLGVDPTFRPAMLSRPVGVGRVPRFQRLDRWLIDSATAFRRSRALRPIWWRVKRMGIGDRLRALNTSESAEPAAGLDSIERHSLIERFEPETQALEKLLGMELPAWRR